MALQMHRAALCDVRSHSCSIISALFEVHSVTSAVLWKHPEVYLGCEVELLRGRKHHSLFVDICSRLQLWALHTGRIELFAGFVLQRGQWATSVCVMQWKSQSNIYRNIYVHTPWSLCENIPGGVVMKGEDSGIIYVHQWFICRLFLVLYVNIIYRMTLPLLSEMTKKSKKLWMFCW